ncbi:helix-turn-helix domain-containing protein [Candidatus Bathyarchaeota archaeon]|nr:helix-turn-helix domain-containing protein [Candidatus Bathyarchaeota archaeon]
MYNRCSFLAQKRKALLLHPIRRAIFKIICETPGSYFYDLTKEFGDNSENPSSPATVQWHLRKLMSAGLIDTVKHGGKRVYYPKGLRDKEVEKAYTILRNETAREIFIYIVNHENAYQKQIAAAIRDGVHHDTVRWHTQRLSEVDLIEERSEGRMVKYSIGELGKKLLTGSLNVLKENFIYHLTTVLKENCLYPQILEQTRDKLVVKISCPGQDDIEFTIKLEDWTMEEFEDYSEDNDEEDLDGDAGSK